MNTLSMQVKNDDYLGDMDFSEYPFEPSSFQKHALDAIEKGFNVMVTAPTGAGKTMVAERAIRKYSSLDSNIQKRKVIYTSPIKALSNCLFHEFTNKFPDISFGILTGDIKYNPDADCVIMTTEILRNLLYNKKIKTTQMDLSIEIDVYNDVAAVIFDEIHYIGDIGRGRVWEESLILLPKEIQLVMLSATIENPKKFAKWIQDIKGVQLVLAQTDVRPVPLTQYIYMSVTDKIKNKKKNVDQDLESMNSVNQTLTEIMGPDKRFNAKKYDECIALKKRFSKFMARKSVFNDLTRYLRDNNLLPTIMFTLSRKKCEENARNISLTLNSPLEQAAALKIFDMQLRKTTNYKSIITMKEYFVIKDLIVKGIAFHHSGVYHIFREAIEILLAHRDVEGKRQPLIKLLFATETFAVGVNMPTKAVVYTGISKYSDDGFRLLHSHEFNQMSGRAGRRGMDTKGVSILVPNLYRMPTAVDMRKMMCGPNQFIESRFIPNFQFLLKIILTGNNQIMHFIKNSLLNIEIEKDVEYIKGKIDEIVVPEQDFGRCKEYHELLNPPTFGYVKISNKTRKKNARLAKMIADEKGFQEQYKRFLANLEKIKKKDSLQNQLESNNTYVHRCIVKILEFLTEHDYVSNEIDIKSYELIEPSHVKVKGIVASQINECNEILFTEMISRGILDNLSDDEIVAVLATYLNTKLVSDSEPTIVSMDIPTSAKNALEDLTKLRNDIYKDIEFRQLYLDTDWELHLNMVTPAFKWVSGGDLNTILSEYDIFPGNFVKDMVKLNNIIQDVVKTAEVLNKIELMEKLNHVETKLLRGSVTLDSLYIKS